MRCAIPKSARSWPTTCGSCRLTIYRKECLPKGEETNLQQRLPHAHVAQHEERTPPTLQRPERRLDSRIAHHRTQRPWLGMQEKGAAVDRPTYDPKCYLCPGNHRAGGQSNPKYTETFVFTNDYPAMLPDESTGEADATAIFRSQPVRGTCRVLCFTPRHDMTLPRMSVEQIRRGDRRLGVAGRGAFDPISLGSGVREQGRCDGMLEPPSPRPDLGRRFSAQRACEGRRPPAGVLGRTQDAASGRLLGTRVGTSATALWWKTIIGSSRFRIGRSGHSRRFCCLVGMCCVCPT